MLVCRLTDALSFISQFAFRTRSVAKSLGKGAPSKATWAEEAQLCREQQAWNMLVIRHHLEHMQGVLWQLEHCKQAGRWHCLRLACCILVLAQDTQMLLRAPQLRAWRPAGHALYFKLPNKLGLKEDISDRFIRHRTSGS